MPLNLIFISPGTYTLEDDGIPGNNISVIKDGSGTVIFTFGHPADALGFTVSTPGVNIVVNFTDSLGAANFTIGSLTNSAESPDSIAINKVQTTGTVSLAANGPITEFGSDAAPDITAGAVILSASTGVGTGANAIETRTGLFEAETTTGGIAISNIGSVQIGALTPDVDGLDVATSGDITFSTVGSIFLTEANTVTAAEVIRGGSTSGNVVLTASGVNADIIGNVDNAAVSVPRGSVTLTAGRDIQLGTIGADFNNDIIANNAVALTAGRDILIDGFADILSDNFGLNTGANLTLTAGRNVGILNLAGTSASVTASGSAGGDAIITTGVDGVLTVNGPGSFALGSTSGNVIVNADRVLIDAASGISAPSGQVIISPRTLGRETILGSASDSALAIELSDVELNRIFTPDLTIGNTTAGTLTVASAVSIANAANVLLRSQDDIFVNASVTTTSSLRLFAGNGAYHMAGTISTSTLQVQVDNAGDDGGLGGIGRLSGSVSATAVALSGNAEADVLRGAEGIDQIVHGNGGNDTITSSGEGQYFGDAGNDRIVAGLSSGLVNEVLDGGADVDTVDTTLFGGSYVINLATGVTNFGFESFLNFENVITGGGADTLTGTSGANNIQAGGGVDTLNGAGGDDTLDGGVGADTMTGGTGNDIYFVNDVGDNVFEPGAGDGTNDRVFSSVSYSLGGRFIEVMTLTGGGNINGTGNSLAQTIIGNSGNNVLDGLEGADTLQGNGGNDTYMVDNVGDNVVEGVPGEGANDQIFSSVSYSLGGRHIEVLTLTGAGNINGTGNGLAQTIIGNSGNNILLGNDGIDVLTGHGGDDTLDGGGGADTMTGNAGNDTYFVNDVGDNVIEPGAGDGTNDQVFSSVSYSLGGRFIEVMTLTGASNNNGTGNSLGQTIIGNSGNNILDGLGGNDVLTGNAGSDTFRFTTALGAGNLDTITDYSVADDTIQIDNAAFTGLAAGALAAGAFNTGAAATQADDRIIYNTSTGVLLFDADGNGAGAAIQFAAISPGLAMAASEFFVI